MPNRQNQPPASRRQLSSLGTLQDLRDTLSDFAKARRQKFYGVLQQPSDRRRRHFLTLMLIGGSTFAITATACASYFFVRGLILENIKEVALLKVQKGTNEIDHWLGNQKTKLSTLAKSASFRTADWQIMYPHLQLAREENKEDFSTFSLILPDGSHRSTSGSQTNLKDRAYFKSAISGQLTVSDPIIGRHLKTLRVIIATPIWSLPPASQKVIGVLSGGLEITRLSQVMAGLNYGTGSYTFALNSQGVPIVHPDPMLMGSIDRPAPSLVQSPDPVLATLANRMVNRQKGIELAKVNGKAV